MAKFCTKCGKPLADGMTCSCQITSAQNANPFGVNLNTPPKEEPPVFNQSFNPSGVQTQGVGQTVNPMGNMGFEQNTAPMGNQGFNPNPMGNQGFNNQGFGNGGFNQGFEFPNQPNNADFNSNPNMQNNTAFTGARACPRCGRAVAPGRVCVCMQQKPKQSVSVDLQSVRNVWAAVKNHMGIGEPEANATDAYEKDKKIIPDVVSADEGEVPVKQFTVAKLRNRFLGVPYMKAMGRVQVTNKRVIFRAPGRCIAGKTAIQHEFAIDEIAGIEARKEFVFNLWDLFFGYSFAMWAGLIFTWIDTKILQESHSYFFTALVTVFLALAGCVPFALLRKKWWAKVMGLGGSTVSLFTIAALGEHFDYGWLGKLMSLFGWVTLALLLVSLFFHVIKPNLVLIIKTKGATQAIDISRKKTSILSLLFKGGQQNEEHTGYSEVLPEKDAEKSIRELGAIVTDIQKLGDFGIEKWKEE